MAVLGAVLQSTIIAAFYLVLAIGGIVVGKKLRDRKTAKESSEQ